MEDLEFREIKQIARADQRGRLTIGHEAKAKIYRVMINQTGQILLDPIVNIPERELWVWQNEKAHASLQRGILQAQKGEIHDLGSFALDADLEIED